VRLSDLNFFFIFTCEGLSYVRADTLYIELYHFRL